MQIDWEIKRQHPYCYKSGVWTNPESKYDTGKWEYWGLLKMLKKLKRYLYGVHFLVEINANMLVTQLNLSVMDLPGALVTRWLIWIRLFNFKVRHILGVKYGAADDLSCR